MNATATVNRYEDIIDSRDILDRIEEIEDSTDADEIEERETLEALVEELRNVAEDEPEDGLILIRDTYFVEYAQELAEDIGAIDTTKSYGWPFTCIDWQQAARDLQMDYTQVDFNGVTYWTR